jgi:sphinganine-1-phosphate aldolase
VRDTAARLRVGIEAIEGLRVTGDPIPGVLEIAADGEGVDIGAVGDVMDDRGWHLDRQQGGLHAIVSPSHAAVAGEFLADLAASVAGAARSESRGVEARYGGVG